MKEFRRIPEEDLKLLFNKEVFQIGDTILDIDPISLEDIPAFILLIKPAIKEFRKQGINFDNIMDKLYEFSEIIKVHSPGALALASNINIKDVKRLTPDKYIELLEKTLRVNAETLRGLEKNSVSLMENMTKIMGWITALFSTE